MFYRITIIKSKKLFEGRLVNSEGKCWETSLGIKQQRRMQWRNSKSRSRPLRTAMRLDILKGGHRRRWDSNGIIGNQGPCDEAPWKHSHTQGNRCRDLAFPVASESSKRGQNGKRLRWLHVLDLGARMKRLMEGSEVAVSYKSQIATRVRFRAGPWSSHAKS